ncbi:pseudouridine synthase [Deinococcus malanensis]|uniref:pseudouridine synthase n=1 Tax=Deinococcus malanensis TaxID=1706855 RepID=UPI00363D91D7
MPLNSGYAYVTPVQVSGVSVLDFLSAHYRHSAPEVWATRLALGEVEVDGRTVAGAECLRAGQTLVWHRPPWQEEDAPLHFSVLHEDSALLAVHKPSGLPTLPGGGFLEHTLLAVVRASYPGASPLHRLGRGTSGVVLFSRGGAVGSSLSRAWREQDVRKVYRALASGQAAQDETEITAPIGPVPHPGWAMCMPPPRPANPHGRWRGSWNAAARRPCSMFRSSPADRTRSASIWPASVSHWSATPCMLPEACQDQSFPVCPATWDTCCTRTR